MNTPCTTALLLALVSVVPCSAQLVTPEPGASYFDDQGDERIFQLNDHVPLASIEGPAFGNQATARLTGTELLSQHPLPATSDSQIFYWEPGIRHSENRHGMFSRLADDVGHDYANFYSTGNLQLLFVAFSAGALTANTPFDRTLREILHENLVHTPSDEYADFLHEHRFLGDGYYIVPAYALTHLACLGFPDNPLAIRIGDWSGQTFRGFLVGAPPMLFMQNLTGGSRPGETNASSSWKPFQDDNGVSGHAFMGAVPFLTAAHLTENRWAKSALIGASLLPGLSRITDDRHYPSQVFLGWTIAWVATSSVAQSEKRSGHATFEPMVIGNNLGLGFSLKW